MTPKPSSAAASRRVLFDLPERMRQWRRERGDCLRCNGMTGIYVASNGGRTFVGCPDCKGTGRATA